MTKTTYVVSHRIAAATATATAKYTLYKNTYGRNNKYTAHTFLRIQYDHSFVFFEYIENKTMCTCSAMTTTIENEARKCKQQKN